MELQGKYYHGGIAGKAVGDLLVPSPPHVEDGCPICEARAAGRTATVGEYRRWLHGLDPTRAAPVLKMLADADDDEPMDPPSRKAAVYVTSDFGYARWYAARSRGDLYLVQPLGAAERSAEDPFPAWTVGSARIVRVVERSVRLCRRDRREMMRRWKKADKAREEEAT